MSDSGLSTSPSPGSSLVDERVPLQMRYPGVNIQPSLGPYLLQKRISRKFFDSGDYNMAKAKILQYSTYKLTPHLEEAILYHSTGETIATPDTIAALRKKLSINSNSCNNNLKPTASNFSRETDCNSSDSMKTDQ